MASVSRNTMAELKKQRSDIYLHLRSVSRALRVNHLWPGCWTCLPVCTWVSGYACPCRASVWTGVPHGPAVLWYRPVAAPHWHNLSALCMVVGGRDLCEDMKYGPSWSVFDVLWSSVMVMLNFVAFFINLNLSGPCMIICGQELSENISRSILYSWIGV